MSEDSEPDSHLRRRHCEPPGVHTLCNLRTLLDKLQRAHRHEVALYTSGHLNPNNLYRPPEVVLHHWRNANRPAPGPTPGAQKASDKRVAAMRDALAYFTVHTAVSPSEAQGTRLFGYLHPPAPGPPASEGDVAAQPGAGRGPLRRRREELRWPELKVLRFRPPRSSRGCPLAAPGGDEVCYVSSYLAGVTRADKYRRFLSFQRDVLATRDRLQRDFTGRGVAAGHEERLERELRRVCLCDPQELGRLQVLSRVFEDICRRSLVFGDLLKEVKDEYELYTAILLSAQPTEQYETLLAQAKGLETSSARTVDVHQAKEELRALVAATKAALEHNDGLRRALEEEQRSLQRARDSAESPEKAVAEEEGSLTLSDQVQRARCAVLEKLDGIQALEREAKTTLVHTGILRVTESRVKSIETETIKLERANTILKGKINIIENQLKNLMAKSKMSGEELRNLWEFINEYVKPKETENNSEVTGQVTHENSEAPCA